MNFYMTFMDYDVKGASCMCSFIIGNNGACVGDQVFTITYARIKMGKKKRKIKY